MQLTKEQGNKLIDEIMSIPGIVDKVNQISLKEGDAAKDRFISKTVDEAVAKWKLENAPPSGDILAVRERVIRDIEQAKTGKTDFGNSFSPVDGIEQQAKSQWANDANLRAEFMNDFSIYVAFAKAEAAGQVRIAASHVIR